MGSQELMSSIVCLPVCLSASLSVSLSACSSVCLSVRPSLHPSICLSSCQSNCLPDSELKVRRPTDRLFLPTDSRTNDMTCLQPLGVGVGVGVGVGMGVGVGWGGVGYVLALEVLNCTETLELSVHHDR